LRNGSAVAQVFGLKVSGLLAWILWRCIYLMRMPGLNRKVRIGTDWLLHLLFPPDLAQTKVAGHSDLKTQHFEPGEIVFHEGDLGDSVYVIESGQCDVVREENGGPIVLATLQAGDYFGEMAVLSDKTRNASIACKTTMDVLLIPKGDFEKLRKSVPAFGDVFRQLAEKHTAANRPTAQTATAPGGSAP